MKKEMAELGVMVVGAGALGNEVVWNLGVRRVGRVLCVDPDRVEASNLGLARMFTPASVGQAKASALAQAAAELFPQTNWEAFDGEIADLGWGRIEGSDLIFGCVDRDSARLEVARIGTRLGIPVCDGGLGVCGRVSYFPSLADTACFGCRLTAARRRELLSSWRSQAFSCREPASETSRVSTMDQVQTTAALQVELGLVGGEAMTTEIRPGGVTRFAMSVSDSCPFHEERQEILQPLPERMTPDEVYRWEWPICLRAGCQNCKTEWRPLVRRARLRACPLCGSAEILALECVDRIEASSPFTPEDIGLPEDHRYTVRVKQAQES